MLLPQSFQTELDSHQPSYDSANTSGQRLIGGVLDDPALTDQALEEMREKWEELCLCSAKKQEMLDIALEVCDVCAVCGVGDCGCVCGVGDRGYVWCG